jgi:hypothetical protein
MALMLAALLIASSAHAQIFDAKGNLQANVAAVYCRELPRVDEILTSKEIDKLIGTFGIGYMHGYFVALPAKIGETLYPSEIRVQGGEMNH